MYYENKRELCGWKFVLRNLRNTNVSVFLCLCVSVFSTCFPIRFSITYVSQQEISFAGELRLSRFTDNGLEYQGGRCHFRGRPMPTTNGVHVYNLKINPSENNLFSGPSLTIRWCLTIPLCMIVVMVVAVLVCVRVCL